jgi:hypothetical protein
MGRMLNFLFKACADNLEVNPTLTCSYVRMCFRGDWWGLGSEFSAGLSLVYVIG